MGRVKEHSISQVTSVQSFADLYNQKSKVPKHHIYIEKPRGKGLVLPDLFDAQYIHDTPQNSFVLYPESFRMSLEWYSGHCCLCRC